MKKTSTSRRLAFAFETVTSRLPDKQERRILSELLRTLEKNYRDVLNWRLRFAVE
ncbi:MAG: hypothetical protein CM1200mP2_18430 [Planctomycetaceae bacterium]|nr:MAG: hypothetical protein CM1200mP2_18430 [Planctomycetaceae bacterium]